jgi:hypothetical protein
VAVRGQAKRLGVEMEIDRRFYEQDDASESSFAFWLDTLPIRARIIGYPGSGLLSAHGIFWRAYRKTVEPWRWHTYTQPLWALDESFFEIQPWTIISGNFQSLLFLLPRDEEILAEVDLWKAAPPQAVDKARSIAQGRFASVHVRRGDAVWRKGESDSLPVWQDDYLSYVKAAMDLIRKKAGQVTFLIFSDDIEWCKQMACFGTDCEFLESDQFGDNPAIDLLLMSACSHHIVANSTYSWWAAWATANERKICILPRMWTPKDTTEALRLVYPGWLVL